MTQKDLTKIKELEAHFKETVKEQGIYWAVELMDNIESFKGQKLSEKVQQWLYYFISEHKETKEYEEELHKMFHLYPKLERFDRYVLKCSYDDCKTIEEVEILCNKNVIALNNLKKDFGKDDYDIKDAEENNDAEYKLHISRF